MASPVTQLLAQSRAGSDDALEQLIPLVYGELRRLAGRCLRGKGNAHTLQPTALVSEAYLQLVDQRERNWANRQQFLCIAATMMRRVLLRHAERRRALKRAGDRKRVTLVDDLGESFERSAVDLVALDAVLTRLEKNDPRKHRIVELRFFGGLRFEEIAHVLAVSERTVLRDWSFARSWLRKEMGSP